MTGDALIVVGGVAGFKGDGDVMCAAWEEQVGLVELVTRRGT